MMTQLTILSGFFRMCRRRQCDFTVLVLEISFWLCCLPLAVTGEGYVVNDEGNQSLKMNITADPTQPPCVEDADCGGQVAGAVIGSLIAGLLIGAAVTYLAMNYLGSRKAPIPPKDYSVTESERFDENRNNGETTFSSDSVSSDPPSVKSHKKLERLVKPTNVVPGDIEIPSAATPLISNVTPSVGDGKDISSSGGAGGGGDIGDDGLAVYSNLGEEGRLSQPYEALDIIPEEVEYENAKVRTYEQFPPNVPPKVQSEKA